jgi:hypothetical protein
MYTIKIKILIKKIIYFSNGNSIEINILMFIFN